MHGRYLGYLNHLTEVIPWLCLPIVSQHAGYHAVVISVAVKSCYHKLIAKLTYQYHRTPRLPDVHILQLPRPYITKWLKLERNVRRDYLLMMICLFRQISR